MGELFWNSLRHSTQSCDCCWGADDCKRGAFNIFNFMESTFGKPKLEPNGNMAMVYKCAERDPNGQGFRAEANSLTLQRVAWNCHCYETVSTININKQVRRLFPIWARNRRSCRPSLAIRHKLQSHQSHQKSLPAKESEIWQNCANHGEGGDVHMTSQDYLHWAMGLPLAW